MEIEAEKMIVSIMIEFYYKKHACAPAPEQEELLFYAMARLDRCPHGNTKPVCTKCKIHCYNPAMREKIRMVMRYSGPRMLLHHPVMAIRHLLNI